MRSFLLDADMRKLCSNKKVTDCPEISPALKVVIEPDDMTIKVYKSERLSRVHITLASLNAPFSQSRIMPRLGATRSLLLFSMCNEGGAEKEYPVAYSYISLESKAK